MAFGQVFGASGWIAASAPRAAPETRYALDPCPEADSDFRGPSVHLRVLAECRARNWPELLKARGEAPLTAPAGGRSYRFMADIYAHGLGLKIVRLDVDAAGKATITWSRPRGRPNSHAVSSETLAAFDAALAGSRLDKTGAQKIDEATACEGDETVFEAVVGGRYKAIVEPCGDEAGLDKALAVLDGES